MVEMDDKTAYDATVAEVIDDFKVVINRGSNHGVHARDRFLIYKLTDEILDPDTNESLGRLEITKGTGRVINVQEKMALVESDARSSSMASLLGILAGKTPPPSGDRPFDNPEIGDRAKKIIMEEQKNPIPPLSQEPDKDD